MNSNLKFRISAYIFMIFLSVPAGCMNDFKELGSNIIAGLDTGLLVRCIPRQLVCKICSKFRSVLPPEIKIVSAGLIDIFCANTALNRQIALEVPKMDYLVVDSSRKPNPLFVEINGSVFGTKKCIKGIWIHELNDAVWIMGTKENWSDIYELYTYCKYLKNEFKAFFKNSVFEIVQENNSNEVAKKYSKMLYAKLVCDRNAKIILLGHGFVKKRK